MLEETAIREIRKTEEERERSVKTEIGDCRKCWCDPVSYTHLDVYKRQADEVFPQRVFYQMVLLEALLEQVGAKQAALYKVCIEDEIARETEGVQEERKADSNRQLLG